MTTLVLGLGQAFTHEGTAVGGAPPPFDPSQIAGLQAWYDASDASTYTFGSGSSVSQHRDKSGKLHHQNQGVVALQPFRNGVRNGLPTNSYLSGRYTRYLGNSGVNATACTIFAVVVQGADSNYQGFLSIHAVGTQAEGSDNASILVQSATGTDYWYTSRQFSGANIVGSGALPYGLYSTMHRADGSTDAWKDGVRTPGTAPNVNTYAAADGGIIVGERLYLGAPSGSTMNGEFAEIIVYDSELSALNFKKVENYLRAKWATPAPPPPPTLTTLTPSTIPVNISSAVTITGTGFVSSSVVYADTTALATTYVSATSLTVNYLPTVQGTVQFTVRSGFDISNQLPLTVGPPAAFAPDQIPGLQEWYDASDPAMFTYSSGVAVSAWINKVPADRTVLQSTVANQPWRDTVRNGLSSVRFDNDGGRGLLRLAISSGVNVSTVTIFAVFAQTVDSDSAVITLCDSGQDFSSPNAVWLQAPVGAGYLVAFRNAGYASLGATTDVTPWGLYRYIGRADLSMELYRDGVSGGAVNSNGGHGVASYVVVVGGRWVNSALHSGTRMRGEIAEILVYDSVLSAGNIASVETYLKAKWATP